MNAKVEAISAQFRRHNIWLDDAFLLELSAVLEQYPFHYIEPGDSTIYAEQLAFAIAFLRQYSDSITEAENTIVGEVLERLERSQS